jgi:hypothetical protein
MEKLQAVSGDRDKIERLIVAIETLEKSEKDTKEGESREQK